LSIFTAPPSALHPQNLVEFQKTSAVAAKDPHAPAYSPA